jgi:hypothetical protein
MTSTENSERRTASGLQSVKDIRLKCRAALSIAVEVINHSIC